MAEDESASETVNEEDFPIVEDKEIDNKFSSKEFSPPLGRYKLSIFERVAIGFLLSFFVIMVVGSTVLPDLFWSDFLKPLVWDPITKDATVGDSGYTPQNTALFIIVLFSFVVVISTIFRIKWLPISERTLVTYIPWVIWASVIRVLEDSQFFSGDLGVAFISPIIHFHIAAWVILAIYIGVLARRHHSTIGENFGDEDPEGHLIRSASLFFLFLMFAGLLLPSINSHEGIGTFGVVLGLLASLVAVFSVVQATEGWHAIERSVMAMGMGALAMWLGLWLQFMMTPWHEANDSAALWPILVVIGIPSYVCWVLFKFGINEKMELEEAGMEPGVLPEDVSIEQHEEGNWEGRALMERLAPRALMATPWALALAFGQLADGLATWIGIDVFGYSEKHPLSDFVIQQGAAITGGGGAWLFFCVKALLLALLLWVFSAVRIEHRQKALRLLIVLAILVVGLAPGLRDLGRLILGV